MRDFRGYFSVAFWQRSYFTEWRHSIYLLCREFFPWFRKILSSPRIQLSNQNNLKRSEGEQWSEIWKAFTVLIYVFISTLRLLTCSYIYYDSRSTFSYHNLQRWKSFNAVQQPTLHTTYNTTHYCYLSKSNTGKIINEL